MPDAPDRRAGGSEGILPSSFNPWQRGVTCTVRPEWLAPIDPQRTYLANVTVQRVAPLSELSADYGPLYNAAVAMVRKHGNERPGGAELRTWIHAHAWFRMELPRVALISATVTLGLSATKGAPESAEGPPPAERLRHPSGGAPEAFARKHEDENGHRRIDHLYTDFDRSSGPGDDVTLSYGEYAQHPPSDFGAFLARAERLGHAYDPTLELVMREWRATKTDKTTDLPWIVVAETYLRPR